MDEARASFCAAFETPRQRVPYLEQAAVLAALENEAARFARGEYGGRVLTETLVFSATVERAVVVAERSALSNAKLPLAQLPGFDLWLDSDLRYFCACVSPQLVGEGYGTGSLQELATLMLPALAGPLLRSGETTHFVPVLDPALGKVIRRWWVELAHGRLPADGRGPVPSPVRGLPVDDALLAFDDPERFEAMTALELYAARRWAERLALPRPAGGRRFPELQQHLRPRSEMLADGRLTLRVELPDGDFAGTTFAKEGWHMATPVPRRVRPRPLCH